MNLVQGPGIFPMMAITLALLLPVWFLVRQRARSREESGFNLTDDWIPGPEEPVKTPTMTILTPYDRELITSYLEPGETLEGFGRGFFVPARMKDWRPDSGLSKLPLLVAATSRRILLFEVRLLQVLSTCFIRYEDLDYLQPPKRGILGTSGRTRFGLKSGREYQFGLLGPLLNEEGMRQEQNMAECFRGVAERIEASPSRGSFTGRAAA